MSGFGSSIAMTYVGGLHGARRLPENTCQRAHLLIVLLRLHPQPAGHDSGVPNGTGV